MKAEFILEYFDDERFKDKLIVLSRLEAAFDDYRNKIPEEYYYIADDAPLGSKIKVTLELINSLDDKNIK